MICLPLPLAATSFEGIMLRKWFLAVALMGTLPTLCAQDSTVNEGRFRFVSIKGHSGRHLYTGETLGDKLKRGYTALELRYGWQPKADNSWAKYWGYPAYGIGWYSGYVGDVDVFGSPHALYGFIDFPIVRGKRHDIQVEPALGLTYNLRPYSPKDNVINDAIGSKFAVYFSLHAGGKLKVSREIDVLYGVDLTHFSNGRTVTPNMGLNMYGFSIGARYHYNADQRKVDNSLHPTKVLQARPTLPRGADALKIKENNISLYQAFGTVQNKRNAATNTRYLTISTLLEYQHKFSNKHGITFGADALWDYSAADTIEYKNNPKQEVFFPAAHIGYDLMFWKLTVKLQVAFHLTQTGRDMKGNYFVRPAVRYDVNNRLFAQAGLKTANGATADWVEVGMGYKFYYRKK